MMAFNTSFSFVTILMYFANIEEEETIAPIIIITFSIKFKRNSLPRLALAIIYVYRLRSKP